MNARRTAVRELPGVDPIAAREVEDGLSPDIADQPEQRRLLDLQTPRKQLRGGVFVGDRVVLGHRDAPRVTRPTRARASRHLAIWRDGTPHPGSPREQAGNRAEIHRSRRGRRGSVRWLPSSRDRAPPLGVRPSRRVPRQDRRTNSSSGERASVPHAARDPRWRRVSRELPATRVGAGISGGRRPVVAPIPHSREGSSSAGVRRGRPCRGRPCRARPCRGGVGRVVVDRVVVDRVVVDRGKTGLGGACHSLRVAPRNPLNRDGAPVHGPAPPTLAADPHPISRLCV